MVIFASSQIFDLSWSPDGTHCVTVCKDGKIRLYDPRSSLLPIAVSLALIHVNCSPEEFSIEVCFVSSSVPAMSTLHVYLSSHHRRALDRKDRAALGSRGCAAVTSSSCLDSHSECACARVPVQLWNFLFDFGV